MKTNIIVDTSSFVDYLRYGKGDLLPFLALNDRIILSQVVRLELLKGVRRQDRKALLNLLGGLNVLAEFPSADLVETTLLRLHSRGFNLGFAY